MARYGGFFKYGHFQKYGAEMSVNLLWAFEVDWDNDGLFDGSGEHTRLKALSITRGREGMFSSSSGVNLDLPECRSVYVICRWIIMIGGTTRGM